MSLAFEITSEDVLIVANRRMGLKISGQRAEEILSQIDADEVESAALEALEMDEQTMYAHDEIERQIKALNLASEGPATDTTA